MRRADLLLNFDYSIDPLLLSCFRRTAVVDIDPGLLQFWMATRQLLVPPHDVYFTTGETVGTPSALFRDGGRSWVHIRPPVCLERWPYVHDPRCEAFTTVSSWWGRQEYVTDGTRYYDNNKRVSGGLTNAKQYMRCVDAQPLLAAQLLLTSLAVK